ncbi:MAG: DUF2490 domain-containing protein [Chryseolinea sp.]
MTKLRIALILFFFAPLVADAQTRIQTTNTNAWLMYFGNHKFSSRIGLHAEIQWRRNDFFSENQQLLLRTGLDFYLKHDIRFTVGYAFIETYPYGEFAVPQAFPEHRIWQQLLVQQILGNVKLSHRYRLEQRMIGNSSTGQFQNGRYENRVRYMAKATFNITNDDHPIFAAVYDEVFINFGKDVAYNIFDQNRLYGAIGYTISPTFKVELGYLYQIILLRNLDVATQKNQVENNHTLQIGLFSNLSFIKKK